jgi:hypothetical protein
MIVFTACNNGGSKPYKKATDGPDAGREFIRASLDGNYDKAKFYLLQDSVNIMILDKWKNGYNKLANEERVKYLDANILPVSIQNENDSTISYVFTNTYKNTDTTTIKIFKINGEWLVDLKDIH